MEDEDEIVDFYVELDDEDRSDEIASILEEFCAGIDPDDL